MSRLLVYASIVALIAACVADDGPMLVAPGPPMQAEVEVLLSGDIGEAAPLEDFALIVDIDGSWKHLDPLTGTTRDLSEQNPGELLSWALVPPGGLLLAGEEGLFAYRDGQLLPSPLDDLLGDDLPNTLLAVDDNSGLDLWLGSSQGLRLWRNGQLFSVDLGDLPASNPMLAYGAPFGENAVDSLWVASGLQLYALVEGPNAFMAWPEREDLNPSSIAVDSLGALWVVSDGELHRRDPDGQWQYIQVSHPVRRMIPAGDSMWLETDSGLWIRPGERFRPVNAGPDLRILAVDSLNRLLADRSGELVRISQGRPLAFLGLVEEDWVSDLRTVTLLPTLARRVADIQFFMRADAPEAVEEELVLDPENWSLLLDPLEIAEGPYIARVLVHYVDMEEPEESVLPFSIGSPEPSTWTEDIQPLFLERCTPCHEETGESPTKLYLRSQWQQEIDDVIPAVSEGRMPLLPNPPLTQEEIQLIRAWRAGGFIE